jgi:hypothetical protein
VRAFLSYSHANKAEAAALSEEVTRETDLDLTMDAIDLLPYSSPKSFMESVREHDAVLHLISPDFLRSFNCMRELLEFMKDDMERNHYRERTVPLIVTSPPDDLDLFDKKGQLQIVDFWWEQRRELEDEIGARKELGAALDDLRGDLTVMRDIGEKVMRFMRTVTESIYVASYSDQASSGFTDVIDRLHEIGGSRFHQRTSRGPGRGFRASFSRKINQNGTDTRVGVVAASVERSPELKRLADLHEGIVVASEDDPQRPEFPPFSPRFPATPDYRVWLAPLAREITIKDESHNFTGSHKDRMAWEIVVYYKDLIEEVLDPNSKASLLPAASIISNGSAAIAIQVMLRCYGLPPLKVLVDRRTRAAIIDRLESAGCEVYREDLSRKLLDSEDVLRLTDNEDGFDVTSRKLVDPNRRTYYDWLAYEILNCGAKHLFIPVGTGDLFVNVLTVLREELVDNVNDRRLLGGEKAIEGLELYGATSDDRKTKMDKLFAHHRPTLQEAEQVVAEMRDASLCGLRSEIYFISEDFVGDALDIARANKVHADESGIAGLSLLLQLHEEGVEFPPDEEILVVNTGWLHLP